MTEKQFAAIFDEIMLKQLKAAGKNQSIKSVLSQMLDKIETLGPRAGKLIDSRLFIYEIKNKNPPIRLYFKPYKEDNRIYVFQYELKTSELKQQKTIEKIKGKIINIFKNQGLP